MSNSDCSICLESLINGTALASLFCGHVFHHDCILKCSEHQRSTCPLCQKDIHLYQHPVIRLYFDTDSTNNIQTPDDRYEKLKSAHFDLTNKLALLEQKYTQKKRRLQQSEQQRLACEKQMKIAIDTMNTYKRISGVLALETRLNTHDMQQHMQLWRQMDKEDLCLATANLAQRLNTLHKALDSKEKFLERINARMKAMKTKYRAMKLEDARRLEASRLEASQLEREKRKRFFNPDELLSTRKRDKRPAIQVDSGDETDDPDDLFWVPPANTDIPTDEKRAQSNQTGESSASSSSRNRTTDGKESGHRIPETPERQLARKRRLQEMGLYGNGYLRPGMRSTRNDSNNQNNNSDTTHNIIEDDDVSFIDDDDDVGYDSPTSPLPPLRIVSPVRHITLPRLARLSRVIELSSDEETETTHS